MSIQKHCEFMGILSLKYGRGLKMLTGHCGKARGQGTQTLNTTYCHRFFVILLAVEILHHLK